MRRWLVWAVAVAACHKDTPPSRVPAAPASTAVQDALWAKAPDGADVGFVVSPRGMVMAEHAWGDLHAYLKSFPAFAPAERELAAIMAKMGVEDFAWSTFGVDPGKGLAVFLFDDQRHAVSLFGITDRDKFVRHSLGTRGADYDRLPNMICKPVADGYYGCTRGDIANLARIAKGSMRAQLAPAHARGDVEVVAAIGPVEVAAVAQLERGAFVVRGAVDGVPSSLTSWLGSPVTPHVDLDHVSGFGVVNIAPLLDRLPAVPLVGGVTSDALARTIAGPLTITTATGALSFDAQIPLSDPGPAKQLVEHCLELPGLRMLGARLERGKCLLPVPQSGFTIELRVDGHELHVAAEGGKPAAATPTPLARELATGSWHATFWGRGTLLAPHLPIPPTAGEDRDTQELAVRALLMLEELGIAVRLDGNRLHFVLALRTAWSNPDEVVARLLAVPPADVLTGRGGALGKAIADAAPSSPFAADHRAGSAGLMLPAAALGVLAGVAIPGVLDSHKKSREPESVATLNRIGKALKRYYDVHGSFPVGDAATLPDFPTCCGLSSTGHGIDNFCPNSVKAWRTDKIWSALAIELGEPTAFRYGYHSDGKTVAVTATGDTDCDGNFATYTLRGDAPNGLPELMLIKPAPGVY